MGKIDVSTMKDLFQKQMLKQKTSELGEMPVLVRATLETGTSIQDANFKSEALLLTA